MAYVSIPSVLNLQDASADGSTKGICTFTAADFITSAGVVSLDYANGQVATALVNGFLKAADWTTFNNKQAALTAGSVAANKLQAAPADLGAANVTVDLSNTNGAFVTNVITDGDVKALTFTVGANKVVGAQVAAIGLDAETDANKITAIISALRAHGLLGPNA